MYNSNVCIKKTLFKLGGINYGKNNSKSSKEESSNKSTCS